jgi:hypothetical protein
LAKFNGSLIEIHLSSYLTKFVDLIENKPKLHLQTFDNLIKFLLNYRKILPYASRGKIALSVKYELWKNIKTHLINIEANGQQLEHYCENDPNKKIMV